MYSRACRPGQPTLPHPALALVARLGTHTGRELGLGRGRHKTWPPAAGQRMSRRRLTLDGHHQLPALWRRCWCGCDHEVTGICGLRLVMPVKRHERALSATSRGDGVGEHHGVTEFGWGRPRRRPGGRRSIAAGRQGGDRGHGGARRRRRAARRATAHALAERSTCQRGRRTLSGQTGSYRRQPHAEHRRGHCVTTTADIDSMTYFTAAAVGTCSAASAIRFLAVARSDRAGATTSSSWLGPASARSAAIRGSIRPSPQAADRTAASREACAAWSETGCRVGRSGSFSRPMMPLATMASTTSAHPDCFTDPSRLFSFFPSWAARRSRTSTQEPARRAGAGETDAAALNVDVTLLHQLRDESARHPDCNCRLVQRPVSRPPVGVEGQQNELLREQHPPIMTVSDGWIGGHVGRSDRPA